VAVCVDKPRHHDHARGIDDFCIGRCDVTTHGGNCFALDEHIRRFKIAERAVEREHAAALDQNRTTGGACGLLRPRRAGGCRNCIDERSGRSRACGSGAKKLTP